MIPNPVFSAFAFIGFCLSIIPLPWHLEAWNTGTCMYMFWTALGLLNQFINSIVWHGNAINWAPVWCDISARIILGVAVGIPASSLCINRRLYHIACVKTVTITKVEKRRAILVDLSIGLGIPVFQMAIQYIAQGHRFNIYEEYGCYPWTYNTPVGIVLVAIWPIVIGCVSLVYSALTIRAFLKRRSQFKELLSGNNNLNSSRYLRLMLLAGTEILCTIPVASYFLYLNIKLGVQPWISWEDTHSNFSRVDQIPQVIWERIPYFQTGMEVSRWLLVACAIIFFGFFGFADEARKNYRLAFSSVAKRVGYSTASMSSGMTSTNGGSSKDFKNSSFNDSSFSNLPRLEKGSKRDSFDSFDANMSLGDVGGFLGVKEDFSPTATSSGSSTAASSLPPSKDDTYSFSESHPDLNAPEPAVSRSSVTPHSDSPSLPRANSIDMV